MPSFNELIKTDPNYAAGKLKGAIMFLVNNAVPKMYMNPEEFDTLWKILIAGEESDVPTVTDGDKKEEGTPNESSAGGTDGKKAETVE
ncbi:MAG: hypothetical protein NC548_12845 [Lachnospiraceae bacterium]|nr:hypothetical protein [Lachnospiraceae bacterium]MCM1230722.1 hypothetical protein [Ruminococcus flavefaciens]